LGAARPRISVACAPLGASLQRARDVLVRGRREASSGVLGSAMQAEATTWQWVDSCVVGMGERSSKALPTLGRLITPSLPYWEGDGHQPLSA
jgi:hypothetical protein